MIFSYQISLSRVERNPQEFSLPSTTLISSPEKKNHLHTHNHLQPISLSLFFTQPAGQLTVAPDGRTPPRSNLSPFFPSISRF